MTARRPTLLLVLLHALLLLPAGAAGAEPQVTLLAATLRPYVGEEVTLTMEVSYAGRLPVRPVVQWPALDRFVAEEMSAGTSRRDPGRGLLVESAHRAVRPLSSGMVTLRGGGILLGDSFIPAPPLTLRVRPLPPGQPGDLAGVLESGSLDLLGGAGDRQIVVTLQGRGSLDGFPSPLAQIPSGARLVPSGDHTDGAPGGVRQRRFRYLYLPGDDDTALPVFSLNVFDPATGSYRRLETPSAQSRPGGSVFAPLVLPGILVLPAVLVLAWALRRRRRACTLENCLAAVLKRSPEGLPRRRTLEGLYAAGLSPDDLSELVRFWSATDRRRFTPGACSPADDTGEREKQIASRLRKAVDKKVRIS